MIFISSLEYGEGVDTCVTDAFATQQVGGKKHCLKQFSKLYHTDFFLTDEGEE